MTDVRTYPTLYKRDTSGSIRIWRMEFMEGGGSGYHRTISGILEGKMVESGWTVCKAKNVDRSNATTSVEQALAEIAANYDKKLSLSYYENVKDIDTERFVDPMLATDYTKRQGTYEINEGVYAQPKLDGIRCIASRSGLTTRKGKDIVSCPHIVEALAPFFEKNPDAVFDGELYNHDLRDDFNQITSIVRKTKPTKADIARAAVIEYHVYDWVSDRPFKSRVSGVEDAVAAIASPFVCAVETFRVTSQDRLDELYARWTEEGYEGQMVRLDAVEYQVGKRSASLMKRKEFMTAEFPVLRMEEGNGNWAGAVKKFVVQLPDGSENDATPRGKYGDLVKMKDLNKVPKWATVRFFGYTPAGKLRFPIAVDWGFTEARTD